MSFAAPDRPFAPERTRLALRGRVVVRLASGEAPEKIAHSRDVAHGLGEAGLALDGGRLDRALRQFSAQFRATRAFRSSSASRTGALGHHRWDPLEDELGLSRTFRIELDPDARILDVVDALRSQRHVEAACPEYLSVTPFAATPAGPAPDPYYAHRAIGTAAALREEPGDSALIVAVIDSGVAASHPELQGRVRPGWDSVDLDEESVGRDVSLVGDFRRRDLDAGDEVGHGTACASVIAARGVRLPLGLGGRCRVYSGRVLAAARIPGRARPTAIGAVSDIDDGVKTAIDLGARVLNLSFGTPESSLRPHDLRPHAGVVAYARRRGCVLVAASGNGGGLGQRYYPSCLDGVIAVGSVGPTGEVSRFTSRGDHVDLCAPGEHIPAAAVEGYERVTGTSFAAPFVAAASALLLARAARRAHPVDPDLVREILMASARPFGKPTETMGCGTGALDVPAALAELDRRIERARKEEDVRHDRRHEGRPSAAPPS